MLLKILTEPKFYQMELMNHNFLLEKNIKGHFQEQSALQSKNFTNNYISVTRTVSEIADIHGTAAILMNRSSLTKLEHS